MDALTAITREALVATAVLCLPVLALATAIGTLVAVIQAATQVQEQTLTLFPKIVAVGATVTLFGSFALHLCATLFSHAIALLPAIVRAT